MGRGRRFPRRRSRLGTIVNSTKNIVSNLDALTAGTDFTRPYVNATDTPTIGVVNSVRRGCVIKAIWLEFWVSGIVETAVGVSTAIEINLMKNPGSNFTPPTPGTEGSSNEKKFIFKSWKGLIGTRTDGYLAYSWKGWVRIPKRYQRFGQDDLLQITLLSTGVDAIFCNKAIYKWYT